jgi:hypothetical protein
MGGVRATPSFGRSDAEEGFWARELLAKNEETASRVKMTNDAFLKGGLLCRRRRTERRFNAVMTL